MTFPAFSHSPNIFLKTVLLATLFLHACATPEDSETRHHRADTNSSRFEWAVQHYEAGNYNEAIQSFESLRKEGTALSDYDLLPFYLGMSHFKLSQFEDAVKELESFVRGAGDRQEIQEARVTLLLAYEKLERWRDAASLATETDKLTLFQDNRALLKLVWARALREQGEIMGAKAALEEAQPFLDRVGNESEIQPFYTDPNQDLWGRYHFTSLLVRESECNRLAPREAAVPAHRSKKGVKKKKAPRRIYSPWLDGVTDCYREAVTHSADTLFSRDTPWAEFARVTIAAGITSFGEKIKGYLKEESPSLDRHRALQKAASESLYRLLNTIEEKMKNFKNQDLNANSLESLRKLVDPLLVQISSP